jgi:hypothetical protein
MLVAKIARQLHGGLLGPDTIKAQVGGTLSLAWAFVVERVTGLEFTLSAWKTHPRSAITCDGADLETGAHLPLATVRALIDRPDGHVTATIADLALYRVE